MSKIVIIMSTYNGERFLKAQLDSLCSQITELDIILYIRDDGSVDQTKNILKIYESKLNIQYEKTNKNLGAAKSFWKLLMTAPDADYYCFSDQDDIWDGNKLQIAVDAIKEKQNLFVSEKVLEKPILYCCASRTINSDGVIVEEKDTLAQPRFTIISQVISGEMPGCAMCFNHKLLDCIKSKRIKTILMHDLIVMLYAIAEGYIIYDEIPHFSRRVHENNVIATMGKSKIKRLKDSVSRWKKNKGVISSMVKELLDNEKNYLLDDEQEYLYNIYKSSKNIVAKYKVMTSPKTDSNNPAAVRSFKIRVLLNLL